MEIQEVHKLKYLERRKVDIDELIKSISRDDFNTAVVIGHRLKGNGITFGFPDISRIGAALEDAANVKDKNEIISLVDDLASDVEFNLMNISN